MSRLHAARAWRVTFLFAVLSSAACGGGGSGGSAPKVSVSAVDPSASTDLNGGDTVTLTGKNFQTGQVFRVTFGGSNATNLNILGETEMTVRTPPAPQGNPGTVAVEVFSINAGNFLLFDAYTYVGGGGSTPQPQTITPTTFTPSGAGSFTISGSSLGPPGGTVSVIFAGVGTVTGTVSQDAQFVQGRAPVSLGVPASGLITVTIDTGSAQAEVPTRVSYAYTGPTSLALPHQTRGNASQPVAFGPDLAAFCTAGTNGTWGDADDDVILVNGPPGPGLAIMPVMRAPATPVGFLSAGASVVAPVSPTAIAVLSPGPDGVFSGAALDDRITLVTQAHTGTPVVTDFPFTGALDPVPLAALGGNAIAFWSAGPDATAGNGDDELVGAILTLSPPGTSLVFMAPAIGFPDPTAGAANFSIPFSPDGDTVFAMSAGPDATAGTTDDTFATITLSGPSFTSANPARNLQARPVALSPTLLVGVSKGANGIAGDTDDDLGVYQNTGAWAQVLPAPSLTGPIIPAALVPHVRLGAGRVAIAAQGATIEVFDDPVAGSSTVRSFPGTPLFARLGSGAVAVFGPGLTPGGSDDDAILLPADGSAPMVFSHRPTIPRTLAPRTDADRAFGLSPGGDGVFGTGNDDLLEIFQSRALGAPTSVSRLPLTGPLLPALSGAEPLVPAGSTWGLLQAPGPDGVYGATGASGGTDDQLVIVSY